MRDFFIYFKILRQVRKCASLNLNINRLADHDRQNQTKMAAPTESFKDASHLGISEETRKEAYDWTRAFVEHVMGSILCIGHIQLWHFPFMFSV